MFFLQNRLFGRGISMDMDIDGNGLIGYLFSESWVNIEHDSFENNLKKCGLMASTKAYTID